MQKDNDRNKEKGYEVKIIPITAAREWFDPLAPAHVVDIVDKAIAEIYDQKSPAGPLYVRGSITRACEEAFRKALRLSENELAKQLAGAQEEINAMLFWDAGGCLPLEAAIRLRRMLDTYIRSVKAAV
jgi:hypothetical protein